MNTQNKVESLGAYNVRDLYHVNCTYHTAEYLYYQFVHSEAWSNFLSGLISWDRVTELVLMDCQLRSLK
jgi:hypothetical protein